jgi:hypothetical protein
MAFFPTGTTDISMSLSLCCLVVPSCKPGVIRDVDQLYVESRTLYRNHFKKANGYEKAPRAEGPFVRILFFRPKSNFF